MTRFEASIAAGKVFCEAITAHDHDVAAEAQEHAAMLCAINGQALEARTHRAHANAIRRIAEKMRNSGVAARGVTLFRQEGLR